MAETAPNYQPQIGNSQPLIGESEEQRLKYLEFVQLTALQAILYVAKLYGYAKNNSGPLKPGVQTVEDTVKTVVDPVYNKFQDVPLHLLKFVDRKVDESLNKIESRVPPLVRQVSTQAVSAAQKAPAAARNVASEVKTAGVVGTASGLAKTVYAKYEPAAKELYIKYEPAAKELYVKYEPVAEQYVVAAWRSLNRFPFVPMMAEVLAPTASYYSEKYNQTVQLGAEKGYKLASYLPLVPRERIAKIVGSTSS